MTASLTQFYDTEDLVEVRSRTYCALVVRCTPVAAPHTVCYAVEQYVLPEDYEMGDVVKLKALTWDLFPTFEQACAVAQRDMMLAVRTSN